MYSQPRKHFLQQHLLLPAIANAEQRSRREKKSLVAVYWFINQEVCLFVCLFTPPLPRDGGTA